MRISRAVFEEYILVYIMWCGVSRWNECRVLGNFNWLSLGLGLFINAGTSCSKVNYNSFPCKLEYENCENDICC